MTNDNSHAISNARNWLASIIADTEAFAAFEAAGDYDAAGEKRDEITQSALSVQVRTGWFTPGADVSAELAEFEILLSTGGPALRMIGGLDEHVQPQDVRLQWQDWGTPWTDYFDDNEAADEALEAFAGCFWYGDN